MSGFEVSPDELRVFAGKLDGHRATAAEIAGLAAKADVSNKSWGVVGLFVKDNYTQMLNDLNELFTAMQEGLQSGADKFTGAAQDYADQEEAVKQLLNGLQIELDNQ
ncbi:WXG100 family type VII secretion target [Saccharothrix yanglingensis]|uniref:ESX-1 secretion-associated protein n=1 Tax=Saccharothrix yanglingensis TaxID=659496 RepID=A0ABU0X8V5_9PSEU|nr:type VII secretion target [Saccharothrix yanglingensis]MDQ2588571.1 ESX-1 secretion-associated protein [Saccharothrix yanglingensis]